MNALQIEVTPATTATEIRMERSAHRGSFLLTEGWCDAQFFAKFIDADACSITNCCGRENVLAVVEILEADAFEGLLAVIDADFGALLGEEILSPNVCITDHNDIECMILTSESAQEIFREYASAEKISDAEKDNGSSVIEQIVEQAAIIGSLRVTAKKMGWPLRFKGMKYHFESNISIAVDRERMTSQILARSRVEMDLTVEQLIERSEIEFESCEEKLFLCSGHDFCRVFARSLRSWIGSHNGFERDKTLRELGRVMRLTYNWQQFITTGLFRCILAWERRNTPYKVLSEAE